jgi:hypothetical protein
VAPISAATVVIAWEGTNKKNPQEHTAETETEKERS